LARATGSIETDYLNGEIAMLGRLHGVPTPVNALLQDLVGTNDFQSIHLHTAWHSAQGIAALVDAIRRAPVEPGMPTPEILVVAPPPVRQPRGPIAAKFQGAEPKSAGLAAAYEEVARERGCGFFDAGRVTQSSTVDGVHLDADQHRALGLALAEVVAESLAGRTAPGGR
jgi:lysophospholipase L1-like esterase